MLRSTLILRLPWFFLSCCFSLCINGLLTLWKVTSSTTGFFTCMIWTLLLGIRSLTGLVVGAGVVDGETNDSGKTEANVELITSGTDVVALTGSNVGRGVGEEPFRWNK